MRKKTWLYFGIFGVLLAGFYIGLLTTTEFGEEKLPILSNVRPFSFTNQNGLTVTEKDIAGKVLIVEYFFTTCKGICPKMNKNMQALYGIFKEVPDFVILSHTVDPETDTVERMKRYADSIGGSSQNWWFLTGTKESLYRSARESYMLDNEDNSSKNISEQFIHTQFFALVDRNGRVRGIYDGLKKDEVKQLERDTRLLLNEKP